MIEYTTTSSSGAFGPDEEGLLFSPFFIVLRASHSFILLKARVRRFDAGHAPRFHIGWAETCHEGCRFVSAVDEGR